MKYSKDLKELVPEISVRNELNLLCYFPLFTSSVLLGVTTASVIVSSVLVGLVKLNELPFVRGSFWSSGIILASLPGFLTVWSFHQLAWTKIKNESNQYYLFFSCFSGFLSQVLLLLSGISPIEKTWLGSSFLAIQDDIILRSFLISSSVFAICSLSLTFKLRQNPGSAIEGWVYLKMCIVTLILCVELLSGGLYFYSKIYNGVSLELLNEVVSYVLFYIFAIYFSTFYLDLSEVHVLVKLEDDDYQDPIYSTF